jgi:hypothetical protein
MPKISRARFYLDALERSAWTAVQAFAAAFTADLIGFGTAMRTKAVVAAAAALYAFVKAFAATKLPWTETGTASTLPVGAVRAYRRAPARPRPRR